MTHPRISIVQSMAIVLYLGFGFAALRNADAYWAGATYTLAITMIAAALVGALARKSGDRMTWTGFAVFGWTYLLVLQLPPWDVGGLGFGPIPKPILLIEFGIAPLRPYIYPTARGRNLTPYEQIMFAGSPSSDRLGRSCMNGHDTPRLGVMIAGERLRSGGLDDAADSLVPVPRNGNPPLTRCGLGLLTLDTTQTCRNRRLPTPAIS
jgi:hypothetical protein